MKSQAGTGHVLQKRALSLESSRPGVKLSSGISQLCDLGEVPSFCGPQFSYSVKWAC